MKVLATLASVAAIAAAGLLYPATMEVTGINGGIADVMTSTGYVYQIEAEDYVVGDLVSMLMWSNGTQDIEDDTVVVSRFSGFTVKEAQ